MNEAPRPFAPLSDVVSSHTSLREAERSIHPRPKNVPWSSASYDKILPGKEKKIIKGGVKLNLGCGTSHKKGYINIDIQEPCDLKHDITTPLPFEDNSVDEIFSEGNVVCLISRKEWLELKKEIGRVLKVGGKLELIFFDFEYIIKSFLDNKDGERWKWWWQTIFSPQENEYNFSKNGFTYEKMMADLFEEGMMDFKKEKTGKPEIIHLTCFKRPQQQTTKKRMKILIGTPIHEVKDYSMERWLENVSKLEYPADFMMVDNSPGLQYVEKVKGYCKKYGIENYKIEHLEINQHQPAGEKIGRSREIIRQEFLSKDYDAWFSWECDQIIPINALDKLAGLMEEGNFMMVHHNSWARDVAFKPLASFGVCLIKRECLEKYGFLLEYPNMPGCWHRGEVWFQKQVLAGGGNYIEVYGVIEPIYHLDDPKKQELNV